MRTAAVRPGPELRLPPGEPLRVEGPQTVELDGATCWIPPGWVGARDGTTLATDQTVKILHQVLGAQLRAVAEEMGAVLVRSAFSANIKERRDCSTALFDAQRPHDRPGRAHPRPPRRHARGRRRRPRPRSAARRGLRRQRPLHRRHASPRHHARLPRAVRPRLLARAPRRRRRHGAGQPARGLDRHLPGGRSCCRPCASTTSC